MNGLGRRHPKRAQRAIPILTWLTPLGAVISVINVTISMCTGEWLKSFERIPIDTPNGTHKEEFQIKQTVSGLWSLCYSNASSELEMHCFRIEYFAKDRYTPDPQDSTMAIPYAVTMAGPLFIVAAVLLLAAIISSTMGHVSRARRVGMFIGGIIFIIAGLIMLIGLVVYLSVLQSEIGPKLRPRNSLEAPLFSYSYGFGFILVVIGFMSTELTGISAIFWYMYWHQLDWAQKSTSQSVGSNCQNLREVGIECSFGDPVQLAQTHRNHHRRRRERDMSEATSDFRGTVPGNYGWRCDLHYPSETKFSHQNSSMSHAGCVRKCQGHATKAETRISKHRYSDRSTPLYYDYEYDMDLPIPPPPPPMPRDLTATTTVSGDEFCGSDDGTLSRNCRKNTPV